MSRSRMDFEFFEEEDLEIPSEYRQLFFLETSMQRKLMQWLKELEPSILEIQDERSRSKNFKNAEGKLYIHYGCTGGGLTYSFIPTGLGVIVKVKEYYTQEEIDLTDYDVW